MLLLLLFSPLFFYFYIIFSDLFSLIPFVFWLALSRFLALFIVFNLRVGFYLISFFLSSAILMYYFCTFPGQDPLLPPYIFNVVMPESLFVEMAISLRIPPFCVAAFTGSAG